MLVAWSFGTKRRQQISSSTLIVDDNISLAWARAFSKVFEAGEISPLVISVEGIEGTAPPEIPAIRSALDSEMANQLDGLSCETVASTIFPTSLWNARSDREQLYDRYRNIFARVKKCPPNRNGVYFQRLIGYGWDSNQQGGRNQLDHIIKTWHKGNHRRSALQAAIFDPTKDQTHQRVRGFPCLQQIAFAQSGRDGLTITGFYATQYMFQRAYGNYLGLFNLGQFMAHEMGLTLTKLVCVSTPAMLGKPKKRLRSLYEDVKQYG